MAKDPAFLFYYQDFLVGTSFMSFEDIGAYIKLLCFLADKGSLSEKEILLKIPHNIWLNICSKFDKDEIGFYNKRLRFEVEKRRAYCESRRENKSYDKHMSKHMENENEDVNVIKDKAVIEFSFEEIWKLYPRSIGKKNALRHFNASVKTKEDFEDCKKALENYKGSEEFKKGFIKYGSTWFNEWKDWLNMKPQPKRIA